MQANRLIHEKSPYLLQHAHNPVDWMPWGEEAFALAKEKDKPIFLSIGYSTCHWCHVMEKESFEDPEIASLLNEAFVCIKVDREELPYVDNTYMEFAQALMGGAGGWPLNVILTPDLKPFLAVTYLPPHARRGLIGLDDFVRHIQEIWSGEERQSVLAQADKIVDMFAKISKTRSEEAPQEKDLIHAVEAILEMADPLNGGIKGAPKFPLSYAAEFLLEFAKEKNESRAAFYVTLTLDQMSLGGIYDHLGGGFSRYCVDEQWGIPHFEKMLYDNALLSKTYLQAWKFTKNERYKEIATQTLDYILRDMTNPDGGFYSAEDADSEGEEGKFYTWTVDEIRKILSLQDAALFCTYFGMIEKGNFEGRNVLFIEDPSLELPENLKEIVFKEREKRPRPFKDDKILTSWNALMIDALIKAASAFNENRYRQAAFKAVSFIKKELWKNGKLLHRFREGDARVSGMLEDYAFMIKALLSLFEEGCGHQYLEWAIEMATILERDFKEENGAFYQTVAEEAPLFRRCDFYDGAEPSGNAVHCENLLRLSQITQNESCLQQAEDILRAAKFALENAPTATCYHLIALQRYLDVKAPTIIVALDESPTIQTKIAELISGQFVPHLALIWKKKEETLFPDKVPLNGQTTVYICQQDRCSPPYTGLSEITKALGSL